MGPTKHEILLALYRSETL